jgi:hypothetical protein
MLRQALESRGFICKTLSLIVMRHACTEPAWWTLSYVCLRNAPSVIFSAPCICTRTAKLRDQARQEFWLEFVGALRDAGRPEALHVVANEKRIKISLGFLSPLEYRESLRLTA